MRLRPFLLAAGAGVLAIGGIAAAQMIKTHTLSVRLPDGGVERIVYTGDTPPKVALIPVEAAVPVFWTEPLVDDQGLLEMMRRLSAEMDALSALPPDASGDAFVSTASGDGVCLRSVEITATGHGQPHVVSRTSGDCGPARGVIDRPPVEAARSLPAGLIQASYVTRPRRPASAGS